MDKEEVVNLIKDEVDERFARGNRNFAKVKESLLDLGKQLFALDQRVTALEEKDD